MFHSNAGGGAGTEVYAFGPATNSERLAQALYKQVATLSPGADRGVKYNPALLEVGNSVHATSALIEVGFHDNDLDSEWIVQSTSGIAGVLYSGICDYYGYDYRAVSCSDPLFYLLIVGSLILKQKNSEYKRSVLLDSWLNCRLQTVLSGQRHGSGWLGCASPAVMG